MVERPYYERLARETERQAAGMVDEKTRASYLEMAAVWRARATAPVTSGAPVCVEHMWITGRLVDGTPDTRCHLCGVTQDVATLVGCDACGEGPGPAHSSTDGHMLYCAACWERVRPMAHAENGLCPVCGSEDLGMVGGPVVCLECGWEDAPLYCLDCNEPLLAPGFAVRCPDCAMQMAAIRARRETAERPCDHMWHTGGLVNGVPDVYCQSCGATKVRS